MVIPYRTAIVGLAIFGNNFAPSFRDNPTANNTKQMATMEATQNLLAGNNCYPDSGANNLVLRDLNDLSIGFEQWSQQNSDRQWKRGPISVFLLLIS